MSETFFPHCMCLRSFCIDQVIDQAMLDRVGILQSTFLKRNSSNCVATITCGGLVNQKRSSIRYNNFSQETALSLNRTADHRARDRADDGADRRLVGRLRAVRVGRAAGQQQT